MSSVVQIKLQNIPYGAYILQMGIDDGGNLYMTFPAIENLFKYRKDSFREKIASKSMKAILGKRLVSEKIKVKVVNKTGDGTPYVNVITFDLFLAIAQIESRTNDHVFDLLLSGFGDSLRSLALKEFGIAIDEESRQAWLGDRHASKEAFHELTNAIDEYIKCNSDKSDNYRKWVYLNCQDTVNRGLFGKAAKKIREELGIGENKLLRDHYGRRALRRLEAIQSLACRYIIKNMTEPQDAVKKAIDEFNYGIIDYRE